MTSFFKTINEIAAKYAVDVQVPRYCIAQWTTGGHNYPSGIIATLIQDGEIKANMCRERIEMVLADYNVFWIDEKMVEGEAVPSYRPEDTGNWQDKCVFV